MMPMRGGPPRPFSMCLDFDPVKRAAATLAEVRAGPGDLPAAYVPSSPPPRREPGCDDDEESPLERFERLAAEFFRATGMLAPGKDQPAAMGGHPTDGEREQAWAGWLKDRRQATGAIPQSDPPPAPPEEPEPHTNSPEDVGFTNSQIRKPAAPGAPRHEPKACNSCGASILWAQTLAQDEAGAWSRVRRDDDKGWKSMPVDFAPTPTGNVQVFHRAGEGIVCRVYRDAAHAPPGAILRTSHFATCEHAASHRRSRR